MWTYMYHLRSILFMILRLVFFFRIRTFTSEDNANLSHNSFGYMYIMYQIYCILIGSFIVFICMYSILVHYCDVIMVAIASQITSLTIVYSTVYSDADQRKHQSFASLAFVRGIHWGPVNSPHKWPVTRKMFPFDDVIMERLCVCVCARVCILLCKM